MAPILRKRRDFFSSSGNLCHAPPAELLLRKVHFTSPLRSWALSRCEELSNSYRLSKNGDLILMDNECWSGGIVAENCARFEECCLRAQASNTG